MTNLARIYASSLLLLTLLGCATATPYQAATDDRPGYRDQRLQEQRYRVSFNGNSSTPRETVENYLLYRSAELTAQKGFDYFLIQKHGTDIEAKDRIHGSSVFGGVGFGMGRRSSIGIGAGSPISTERKYEAIAYLTMHKGAAPKDNEMAYDAKQILANLEPQIKRPKK